MYTLNIKYSGLEKTSMWRNLIVFEFIALFAVLPLAVAYAAISFYVILFPMFIAFGYAVWWLFFYKKMHWKEFWRSDSPALEKKQLKFILLRFIVCSFLVAGLVLVFYPEKILNFPRQYPLFFILFVVTYPLLSVVPQELLYRTFFFERYKTIFNNKKTMIVASTLAFSYLHIMYLNYEAVFLTLVGGYFFSRSYQITHSLRITCFEHSLYGILVFALGLGGFFIRGLKEAGLVL